MKLKPYFNYLGKAKKGVDDKQRRYNLPYYLPVDAS